MDFFAYVTATRHKLKRSTLKEFANICHSKSSSLLNRHPLSNLVRCVYGLSCTSNSQQEWWPVLEMTNSTSEWVRCIWKTCLGWLQLFVLSFVASVVNTRAHNPLSTDEDFVKFHPQISMAPVPELSFSVLLELEFNKYSI